MIISKGVIAAVAVSDFLILLLFLGNRSKFCEDEIQV